MGAGSATIYDAYGNRSEAMTDGNYLRLHLTQSPQFVVLPAGAKLIAPNIDFGSSQLFNATYSWSGPTKMTFNGNATKGDHTQNVALLSDGGATPSSGGNFYGNFDTYEGANGEGTLIKFGATLNASFPKKYLSMLIFYGTETDNIRSTLMDYDLELQRPDGEWELVQSVRYGEPELLTSRMDKAQAIGYLDASKTHILTFAPGWAIGFRLKVLRTQLRHRTERGRATAPPANSTRPANRPTSASAKSPVTNRAPPPENRPRTLVRGRFFAPSFSTARRVRAALRYNEIMKFRHRSALLMALLFLFPTAARAQKPSSEPPPGVAVKREIVYARIGPRALHIFLARPNPLPAFQIARRNLSARRRLAHRFAPELERRARGIWPSAVSRSPRSSFAAATKRFTRRPSTIAARPPAGSRETRRPTRSTPPKSVFTAFRRADIWRRCWRSPVRPSKPPPSKARQLIWRL